jgi:hypothetical protein
VRKSAYKLIALYSYSVLAATQSPTNVRANDPTELVFLLFNILISTPQPE